MVDWSIVGIAASLNLDIADMGFVAPDIAASCYFADTVADKTVTYQALASAVEKFVVA